MSRQEQSGRSLWRRFLWWRYLFFQRRQHNHRDLHKEVAAICQLWCE